MTASAYDALVEIAERQPDAIAFMSPGCTDTTFGELLSRTREYRKVLASFGVKRGSRVGIVVQSRDLMAAAHLSVITVAAAAPLSPEIGPVELERSSTDLRLDYLIVEDRLANILLAAASLPLRLIRLSRTGSAAGHFSLDGIQESAAGDEPESPTPEDISVLLQTSGTTARPKIVPRTQAWQLRTLQEDDPDKKLGPGDRILDALPLHHTEGLNFQFILPLLSGATVVIVNFDPALIVGYLQAYSITKFTMVPSMHKRVLDWHDEHSGTTPDLQLRYVESSSSKLMPALKSRMRIFYCAPIVEDYGATEAGVLAYMGLDQSDLPEGSVGKPAHAGVVVMDESGEPVAPGIRGEVCVKGPNVIPAFENNPEANALQFRDGWYRTGDEAYLNDDGYLFITGRTKENISRGGESIAPLEIDEVLTNHPLVKDAASFGVPHEDLGEEVWAAVVPVSGATVRLADIRSFASRELPFAKVPKRVIQVDSIPLNEIGKVARSKLAKLHGPKSD